MSEADGTSMAERIEEDIALMVSGHFTPDAIGPEAYDDVVERARANVVSYLDVFESRYLGADFDVLAQSELQLPTALDILHPVQPDAVAMTAKRLFRYYDGALVLFDRAPDPNSLRQVLDEDTVHLATRLDDLRRALRALLDRES